MRIRFRRVACYVLVAAAIAVGFTVAGRVSAGAGEARSDGYRTGVSDGYFKGLQAGEVQGRADGRALQEGANLPAKDRQPVQDAFTDGYAAGYNDAFAGYDGGWSLAFPYVIALEEGTGKIAYRIETREPVQAGINYYLCPDGHKLCQEPR